MIDLQVRANLSKEDRLAALDLIVACHVADGSARIPYLSNDLNFDSSMPAFFLAYKAGKLVGLLSLYADDEEAEISLMVHPAYRRQGIATQLFEQFSQATAAYGLKEPNFLSERVFLEKNPGLLPAWDLVLTENSLTQLARGRQPYQLVELADLQVTLADPSHIESIALFQSQTFGEELALTRNYAQQAVADPDTLLYILLKQGRVVASCTVDTKSSVNYLYGLAVLEAQRGQGLGSYLVKSLVNDLLTRNEKTFQIAVEDTNIGAKKLYQKLAFQAETQLVYLKKK